MFFLSLPSGWVDSFFPFSNPSILPVTTPIPRVVNMVLQCTRFGRFAPLPSMRLASTRAAAYLYRCCLRGLRVDSLDVRQAWVFRAPRAGCDWMRRSPPEGPVRRLSGGKVLRSTRLSERLWIQGPHLFPKHVARTLQTYPETTSYQSARDHIMASDGGLVYWPMTRFASKPYGPWEFVMNRPLGLVY